MKTAYLLLLLIAIVITAIVLQKIASSQFEGFNNPSDSIPLPVLKTCPHKMNSFIDGLTNNKYCCDSAVNGNICQGRKVCGMSPGDTDSPSCAQYLADYTKEMSAKKCFGSMPTYYEDSTEGIAISGCASQVNDDFSKPAPGSTSCKIYPDQKGNQYQGDSCENRQMVHIAETGSFCKTVNCTSVQTGGNGSNVAWVNAFYMSQDESVPVQVACETKESTIRHITYGYGDYYLNQPDMQAKTGDELAAALKKVEEGTYPGMCAEAAPIVCNKKAHFVIIQGTGNIGVSQLIAKDTKGNNITRGQTTYVTSTLGETDKDNAVDGYEKARVYPALYMSDNGKDPRLNYLAVRLKSPSCVSEIILYGNLGVPDQNAGKTVSLLGEKGFEESVIWTANVSGELVQKFKIPPNTFA
jgi:hypothetical protein